MLLFIMENLKEKFNFTVGMVEFSTGDQEKAIVGDAIEASNKLEVDGAVYAKTIENPNLVVNYGIKGEDKNVDDKNKGKEQAEDS